MWAGVSGTNGSQTLNGTADLHGRARAVIPGRGGSKQVRRKNLKLLGGKPLIQWSIEAARAATELDRCIVSTDDEEIADVARSLGAEVPFLRPANTPRTTPRTCRSSSTPCPGSASTRGNPR